MADLIPRLIVAEWAPDARACAAIHERVSATMAVAALDHLEVAEKERDELTARWEKACDENATLTAQLAEIRSAVLAFKNDDDDDRASSMEALFALVDPAR